MTGNQRKKEILEYLSESEFKTLKDITDKFKISMNTARRDIDDLAKSGLVNKFYGGVSLVRTNDSSFDNRNSSHLAEKQRIASFVATTIIEDGDLIYMDSGSTTALLLDYIDPSYKLTIVTNNLHVIYKAMNNTNWSVIVVGSTLRHTSHSLINIQNLDYLNSLNLTKAMIATTGLTIKSGATNTDNSEATIKSTMIKRCKSVYLLTDASKLGKTSLVTFASIDEFDHIITSGKVPQHMLDYLINSNIQLTIV